MGQATVSREAIESLPDQIDFGNLKSLEYVNVLSALNDLPFDRMSNMTELRLSIVGPLKALVSKVSSYSITGQDSIPTYGESGIILPRLKSLRILESPYPFANIMDDMRLVAAERQIRQLARMLPELEQFGLGDDYRDLVNIRRALDKSGRSVVELFPLPGNESRSESNISLLLARIRW